MGLIKGENFFNFDGVSSRKWNLQIIDTSGGMYEEQFLSTRTLTKIKPKGREKSMLQNIETEDKGFELELSFMDGFTNEDLEEVALWLSKPYYRPLFFESDPNKVYNAMFTDATTITHLGIKENNQGYFKVTVDTNSPLISSPYILTDKYTVDGSPLEIEINNTGHKSIYPEISITAQSADIVIETINSEEVTNIFEIHKLTVGEGLYLDCFRETIESEILGVFHYDDTIGRYPELKVGISKIRITGNCEIQLRYKLKYIF